MASIIAATVRAPVAAPVAAQRRAQRAQATAAPAGRLAQKQATFGQAVAARVQSVKVRAPP